mmetsp:Transcript_38402/g.120961  ORF Transcript_38402/g.120961 Transcript_38402/m.120961 type:complete len:483 (+) Transcript_38402:190-1638(+)
MPRPVTAIVMLLLSSACAQDLVRSVHYEYRPIARGRGGGGVGGVVPGVGLSVLSGVLLWWNEGRAVRESRMLRRLLPSLVRLDADSPPDPTHDGRLVHLSGPLRASGLVDPEWGLQRQGVLRLRRSAEVYQWREERTETSQRVSEREVRREVTHRYRRTWGRVPVDSSRFEAPHGHHNPEPVLPVGDTTFTATDAALPGGIHVPAGLVAQLSDYAAVPLAGAGLTQPTHLPSAAITGVGTVSIPFQQRGAALSRPLPPGSPVQTTDDVLRQSGEAGGRTGSLTLRPAGAAASGETPPLPVLRGPPPAPEVGDVRLRWSEVASPAEGVSILARQGRRGELLPWSDEAGRGVYRLVRGVASAEEMVQQLRREERAKKWLARAAGCGGMALGLRLILGAATDLISRLPFGIGPLLAALTGPLATLLSIGTGAGLSAIIVALAWVRFRPLAAAALSAAAAAFIYVPAALARAHRVAPLAPRGARAR